MAGTQTESGVTLNPSSGGPGVRTIQVTRVDGTVEQMEAVVLSDPVRMSAIADISIDGALFVREERLMMIMQMCLDELKSIRLILSS